MFDCKYAFFSTLPFMLTTQSLLFGNIDLLFDYNNHGLERKTDSFDYNDPCIDDGAPGYDDNDPDLQNNPLNMIIRNLIVIG